MTCSTYNNYIKKKMYLVRRLSNRICARSDSTIELYMILHCGYIQILGSYIYNRIILYDRTFRRAGIVIVIVCSVCRCMNT